MPAVLAGAGTGLVSESGCVQIQSEDAKVLEDSGLADLRLGDVVAFVDYDARWGTGYRTGAVTVAVVSHGDSLRGGYGPGATPIITALDGLIRPEVKPEKNLTELLPLASSVVRG